MSDQSSSTDESAILPMMLEQHMGLLSGHYSGSREDGVETAPLFTEDVRMLASSNRPFTQYGLLGGDSAGVSLYCSSSDDDEEKPDPRILYNAAAPNSVFICGSQGSGKSHSLGCLLETCLVPSVANVLPRPLTGIVFHYDTFVSDSTGSPCEAAYLSSHANVKVRVLCAPTNIGLIKKIYAKLPNVKVEELRINEDDLNTQRMLDMMAVSSIQGSMPLYLNVIVRILRDLRIEQQRNNYKFNYAAFKRRIEAEPLNEGQLVPLQQRLETLESFMNQDQAQSYKISTFKDVKTAQEGKGNTKGKKPEKPVSFGNNWTPKANQLTIVDLSCPCVTAEMACSLFCICLSLFLEQTSDIGRVIALDEAHKYMTDSAECATFTESLLHTIRVQRHIAARVFISTQEPTISPKLLDLCNITLVHRFTSPDWLETLKKHLAGASNTLTGREEAQVAEEGSEDWLGVDSGSKPRGVVPLKLDSDNVSGDIFTRIVALRTGEALVFAPSAAIGVDGTLAVRLGHGVLKVLIRKRVTQDGGRSIMAE